MAAIALLALLGPVAGAGGPAGAPSSAVRLAPAPASPAEPVLAVDPPAWWMTSGANVTLQATWSASPPECTVDPLWYRWAIGPGASEGSWTSLNGSIAVFDGADAGTGTTELVVRGAATIACPGTFGVDYSRATSNVTVAAPVVLSGLAFTEDPISPGTADALNGSLLGGEPPYGVQVAWGDGTSSVTNVSRPGNFSLVHTYAGAGSFAPSVVVTDAVGRSAEGVPAEPLNVSRAFAAAIVPAEPVAEVGVPLRVRIQTAETPAGYSSLFSCPNGTSADPGAGPGLAYTCSFATAGVSPIAFEAVGSASPFPVATATLREPVVAALSLGLPGPPPVGEVDTDDDVPFVVSGGVGPFLVAWSLVGAGVGGTERLAADGDGYLAVPATAPGGFPLSIVATDELGVVTATTETVDFAPSLELSASAGSATEGNGTVVNVTAAVAEGAPPFDWAVVPMRAPANGSFGTGALASVGAFSWNASFRTEGTLDLAVVVVDADGGSATLNLSVPLAPELSVVAKVAPSGPGQVTLLATISGGVPPYSASWTDSAGDDWNSSAGGPGTLQLRVRPSGTGALTFDLTVTDAGGGSAVASIGATVAGDSGANLSEATPAALGVAGLAVGLVLGLLFRRRRGSSDRPPPLDPVAVLREAIEPSDGVDRGLVEMLAEERGLSREVVQATLERLKVAGTVRSGRGADGEEVLAWSEPARP